MTKDERGTIVEFLKSLTDLRVSCSKAPFDHPELLLPNGQRLADTNHNDRLDDALKVLPATGAGGVKPADCLVNAGDLFRQPGVSYLPSRN